MSSLTRAVVVRSARLVGTAGRPVSVCVQRLPGEGPDLDVVGGSVAAREARARVLAGLGSVLGEDWRLPGSYRVTALDPDGVPVPYESGFDLPAALGLLVLVGGGLGPSDVEDVAAAAVGEIDLRGGVRLIRGLIPLVDALGPGAVVPLEAGAVAAGAPAAVEVGGVPVAGIRSLDEAARVLRSRRRDRLDMSDLRGVSVGVWDDLVPALARRQPVLLVGPAGSGRTMLARRVPGILPPLDGGQIRQVAAVHSAAGLDVAPWARPFRAPHHTVSLAGLLGGGRSGRPGEISLAHNGVLYLEDIVEIPRRIVGELAPAVRAGEVRVWRDAGPVVLPARVRLIASAHACPCGRPERGCTCSETAVRRYARRVESVRTALGAVRIDLPRIDVVQAARAAPGPSSASLRRRICDLARREGETC